MDLEADKYYNMLNDNSLIYNSFDKEISLKVSSPYFYSEKIQNKNLNKLSSLKDTRLTIYFLHIFDNMDL